MKSIGLDIGISSVGWSVLDIDSGTIIESGVRLFSAASAEKNQERRLFRQGRRRIRRRKNRLNDLTKLLDHSGILNTENELADPYEIRKRALYEELSFAELRIALFHLVKRRGVSYGLKDLEDDAVNQGDFKNSVQHNQELLKKFTPGEIQYSRLKQFGKVRGIVKTEDGEILLNVFPTEAYKKEAIRILDKQQTFHKEIDEQFKEAYLTLLCRKRAYFIGPGKENSRTDYGIYRTNGETLENLFSILIGKDKIYPDETRAASASYTAQLFNLVNDLNNLRIDSTEDGKLTTEHKQQIIAHLKETTGNVTMIKLVSNVTGCQLESIKGYRVTKEDKPEIHSLAVYRKARKKFLTLDKEINDWPTEFIDDLAEIITLNTENGEIRRVLTENSKPNFPFLTDSLINQIIDYKQIFMIQSSQKWHRFSLKTMKELLPEMLITSKEQMSLLAERGMLQVGKRSYSGTDNLAIKEVTELIYNPVVAKAVYETLKIINALYEKYKDIQYLVVEMPREDNEDEARKAIKKAQKENQNEKEKSFLEFLQLSTATGEQLKTKIRKEKKLGSKIRLWYQQEGKCLYSGKTIVADELFANSNAYEIDHIIPQSVSFDDSLNNKVLCFSSMNQEKEKQTPFGFMQNGSGQGFETFKMMIKGNKRLSANKRRNLLFTDDLMNIETRKRFISRNLVDTRYASRVILNELQQFVNNKDLTAKVTVVRGKFTSTLRTHWKIYKTRETHHHHAVDAAVIAVSPLLNIWKKQEAIIPKRVTEDQVEVSVSEIVTEVAFNELVYTPPYKNFREEIRKMEGKIKFSHQVDKKVNRKISDATIYTVRKAQTASDKAEKEYVLGKIGDIYSIKGYEDFIKIYRKDKTKFLMQQHDLNSFNKLETILLEYPDKEEIVQNNKTVKTQKVSPFELYRRGNGWITKYAKKNNGPVIKQVKYYDKVLGQSINITPKDSNKTVVLQSLKSWRTDVYFNKGTKQYEIMGIKHSDLRFGKGGQYGLSKQKYENLKNEERISKDAEFLFSLYRNDRIKVIDLLTNDSVELLFGSRSMISDGYVELKPVKQNKFEEGEVLPIYQRVAKGGRLIKKFTKENYKLYKVNTDILGNPYYIEKEAKQPKDIID
ncbi:type II CRISPR RNA-guided endonuclease Cas9 [Enterococcus sp. CWB-B31]|uniref:type II CRISPR RNA-guided endonuclease Cas9 n=1 Tax=Enterococcus sp. CWB-B31 TaxID=2885159 RepID=UPI001E4790F8|nr:type II CRISPR RNA-guided endonuclease Cas9 [Enterococcus sp. CWB-B31]MCB5955766.1 type II CRISPR RNA-guided endonuclease Cas9 [Enterococcus sp. CWB-B31]